jgi:N-acetylneuraminate lyase
MTTNFSGIWPAMLTPLTEAGEPNHDQIEKLVELFVRQKLGGLYILGSTGQWPLLTLEQRRAAAERVVKTAAGRIPVIVHVGAVATDDAVALARHAAQIGADGVSAVTPIYYPASPDVVFEHYRRIGAATELPLFVYHLSVVNQITLDPREYAERVLTLPHIAGMKITDRDLYQFGQIHIFTRERLQLFSGADEVFCQAALSGAVGAIGTFYNLWGPTCQAARKAFVDGSFEVGRSFMLAFQSAIGQVLRSQSVWTFLRTAMRIKYGIAIGAPRAPLGVLDKPWKEDDVMRIIALVEECPCLQGVKK